MWEVFYDTLKTAVKSLILRLSHNWACGSVQADLDAAVLYAHGLEREQTAFVGEDFY